MIYNSNRSKLIISLHSYISINSFTQLINQLKTYLMHVQKLMESLFSCMRSETKILQTKVTKMFIYK